MIKIIQSYNVKASVIAIYSNENKIYFTDCDGNIHTVDKGSWNKKSQLLVSEMQTPLHRFQKGSSFSKTGYVAYSVWENKSCALCLKLPLLEANEDESQSTKIPYNNSFNNEAVLFYGNDQKAEVISFCGTNGEYLFSGGNDGRIYMYNTQDGKISMSLKPKPEYISSITVDNKGEFIAYSAFDKSLTVLNIRRQKEYLNTYLSDVVEHSFFYDDSKFLYAIGRDGNSYVYNLKTDTFSKKAIFIS